MKPNDRKSHVGERFVFFPQGKEWDFAMLTLGSNGALVQGCRTTDEVVTTELPDWARAFEFVRDVFGQDLLSVDESVYPEKSTGKTLGERLGLEWVDGKAVHITQPALT